jgi:hypothetical protein
MKTGIFTIAACFALLLIAFFSVRVLSYHSPTVDLLGSYFPAWMICILSGLALTFVAHWIVQVGKLELYLRPAPLIYSCLMIIFTFATWILLYQN